MRGVTRTTLALNGCQQQQQHLLQHHHHLRAKQLSAIRHLQQIRSLKTTASANGGSSSPINRIAGCSSGQLAHNNVAAAQATTTTTTTTTTHRRQQSTTSANYLAANYSAAKKEEIAESLDELDTTATTDHLSSGAEAASAANKRNRKFADACDSHRFVARHIGPRSWELDQMLATLGYSSLEELIEQTIPDEIRFKRELELPQEISEHELVEQLKLLGAENSASQWKSFIGLGYYDCVTPPVILRNIFENPGWTTAYTAYQAEVAQGRLESLMNFQTMIGDLTGLDVANASLLDESTAAAEAMQVCYRVDKLRRQKFLMSRNCHPQTRAVVETRAQGLGIQVDYFDELLTTTTGQQPNYANYCGALIQYPNTHGHLFNLDSVTKPCHEANCLVIAATDLMACALFKPPGDFDEPADLAVGSAQRFGVPLNFGGPHAGFLACRQALIRSIPGRVVGLTRDSAGNEAYRFALQTREQHIRRDKATSNICTAQALLANMSAMYAIYHGPAGIRSIASAIHRKTSLLAQLITAAGAAAGASGAAASSGAKIINEGAYFDTLTVRLASEEQLELVKRRAREARINLRYYSEQVKNEAGGQAAAAAAASESGSSSCERDISISLDETSKLGDVFRLADLFAPASDPTQTTDRKLTVSLTQKAATTSLQTPLDSEHSLASSLRRQTDYLTHPTFNTYHSEAQLVRYMKRLENKDISLAHSMIPLGSCTMKLNATSQMLASSWPEFARLHPFQPLDQCGGYMKLFDQLNEYLCEITGYDRISFQPNSGAQGEYAGLRVIKSYLESINEHQRNVCLIPISAHGTNPASAQMAGFVIKTVRVLDNGNIDMDDFVAKLEQNRSRLACMMVTYPSTFGVFEENIGQLCDLVHEAGGQVYLDGANMNAQVGLCRPGDYGSDVSHLNLHKTFCIPHGGGGPGAGPIGVKRHLIPFLPTHPLLAGQASACSSSSYSATGSGSQTGSGAGSDEHSFGTVSASMWGSPAILPISWSYIRLMSSELKRSSEVAILNANYMRKRLQEEGDYKILYRGSRGNVAHEFILDCRPFKRSANVEANDIAKRLQDFGLHAPTVSWPVSNTLMLEPTESEDKQQLDNYCEALLAIRGEIRKIERGEWSRDLNPIKMAPHTQQVVCATNWSRPYTREQAAFPAKFVKPTSKIWPTVGRVDDTFGDTNLFCTCPPVVQEQ